MRTSLEQEDLDAAEVELRRVGRGDPRRRVRVVRELAEGRGSEAIELLSLALRDPDLNVRVTTAQELGKLRDSRALEPLMAAFRRSVFGGAAQRQGRTGKLVTLGWLLGFAVVILLLCSGRGTPLALPLAILLGGLRADYFRKRREQSRMQAAVGLALAEIVEHQAAPEVSPLADELRLLSRDGTQQEKASRLACRQAAERIEGAVAQYRDLPVAASGPELGSEALPLPAAAERPEGRDLPRV